MKSMIKKIIILVLVIGFTIGIMESVEGLVEFKEYKVVNSSKVCGDKLCSEIDEKVTKKGESSHNIKICGDKKCADFSENIKLINKSSPFEQMKIGIAMDLIQCKEGQEIVIKKTNQIPACVNSENVEKLREKGWASTEKIQKEIFTEMVLNRIEKMEASTMLENLDVSMSITTEIVNGQRYLAFVGENWHQLHNVEITISSETFSESIRTKTTDRGDVSTLWQIPDFVVDDMYNIFATDGIHDFKINIPISRK